MLVVICNCLLSSVLYLGCN